MPTLLYLVFFCAVQLVSFYDVSVNDTNGSNISFSGYTDKKVLFVNTATNSPDTAQFAGLEQLYQQYKDSLVIIVVPSNDFGNEPRDNDSIQHFLESRYNIHYIIAEKQHVQDSATMSPLYQWITRIEQNGMAESTVNGDFFKYLVDDDGLLIGLFSNQVEPMANVLRSAIEQD
jgi:glutathione peroxidase